MEKDISKRLFEEHESRYRESPQDILNFDIFVNYDQCFSLALNRINLSGYTEEYVKYGKSYKWKQEWRFCRKLNGTGI